MNAENRAPRGRARCSSALPALPAGSAAFRPGELSAKDVCVTAPEPWRDGAVLPVGGTGAWSRGSGVHWGGARDQLVGHPLVRAYPSTPTVPPVAQLLKLAGPLT